MMELGASQPCALRASLHQNPIIVHDVHVRLCSGVTSESMLVQVPSSAKEVDCFSSIQPEGREYFFTRPLTSSLLKEFILYYNTSPQVKNEK